MHIHQYTLLLRVHIIIPVLLIKNSVIMHFRKYALVRIHINALLRIHIIVSQTVQGHCPDRNLHPGPSRPASTHYFYEYTL